MPKSELVIQIGEKRKHMNDVPRETSRHHVQISEPPKSVAQTPTKTFWKMTMAEKWQFIRELTTVEPLIACFILGNTITETASNNLLLEKSCRVDSQFNETICNAILGGKAELFRNETEVVGLNITSLTAWLVPVCTVVPLILSLFWGSFSDRHQIRKPFLLLPMFGELVVSLFCILNVIYLTEWDLTTFGVLIFLVPSFFGGQVPLLFAIFAYIADVSTVEQRTLRVAFGQIVIQVCSIIGRPLSGILFPIIGYYGIFAIYFIIILLGILYGLFILKESLEPRDVDNKWALFLDLFNPHHIKDIFSVLFVKKKGNNRLHVIIIMIILFINSGVGAGEQNLLLIYLNNVLEFTAAKFSFLLTFNALVHLKGNILGVWLFTKLLKLSDYTIINITLLNKMIANVILAIAASAFVFYIGIYVSLFIGITTIGIRSLATKVVDQSDLGKAQSFFGIFEVLGSAIFIPIYNKVIFAHTINNFPSAFFYAAILFMGICVILVLLMQFNDRHNTQIEERNKHLEGVDNPAMTMGEVQTTRI